VILAIDPGVRGCGVAVFGDDALLLRAAYVKNPVAAGNHAEACVAMGLAVVAWANQILTKSTKTAKTARHTLVLEWPRVLVASRQKAEKRSVDPNDLLALVGVDCAIAMAYHEVMNLVSLYPDTWKSQVPKEVMCRRVWTRLSEEERARVERTPRGGGLTFDGYEGGIQHDVLDGCGLGLFVLDRLTRHRVFG